MAASTDTGRETNINANAFIGLPQWVLFNFTIFYLLYFVSF